MYPIGRFSEICNTSVKTLRYYSEIGLLEPSYIDPVTNYRYYDDEKIQIVNKINLLKSFQIPLTSIKLLIESHSKTQWKSILEYKVAELEIQKEEILKQIQGIHQVKDQIDREIPIIPGPELSSCYIENRKDILTFSIRQCIKITSMDQLVRDLFNQAYAFNLVMNGDLTAIFHARNLNQRKADVELLLPIVDANGTEGCRILHGGAYACLTFKGPYSQLEIGYQRLENWILQQNLIQTGLGMEIYEKGLIPSQVNLKDIRPNLNISPTEFMTKICIPIDHSHR
ncbi:MerR family transcriptional regulator [Priestia filamentosa]|uniref:MerR family transcriptional regulator n=1 Tax=Priestia filamentosa TaxID=1402861 RepID=UPI003F163BE2